MQLKAELEMTIPSAPEQYERIFTEFERLAPGNGIELVIGAPEAAPALLSRLQERYGRGFDWLPLDRDGGAMRVALARREPDHRTISGFLGGDHHRLTEYWEEFLGAVQACARSYETLFTTEGSHRTSASRQLSRFIFGLRRHIRMEEDLFFPMLEEKARIPAGAGPTAVMRAEHRRIQELLDAMEKDLLGSYCAALIQAIESQPAQLSPFLHSHDMKEESVLYPLADRALSQADRDALCFRMQAV